MGSLYGAGADAAVSVSESSRTAIQEFEQRCALQLKELLASEERLKQVVIAPADVELLVRELEWNKNLAERVLRLANGDLKALIGRMCG